MRRLARRVVAAIILLACAWTYAGAALAQSSLSPATNYVLRCSGCHGIGGLGTDGGGIPAFPDSIGYIAGLDAGRTYMMHVPGVGSASLSDEEIAAVTNYILERWSDVAYTPFTGEEVTARRALPVEDVVAFRRAVIEQLAAAGITVADYPWP